jgi:nucleoside-diphosphate-sugar epimerase
MQRWAPRTLWDRTAVCRSAHFRFQRDEISQPKPRPAKGPRSYVRRVLPNFYGRGSPTRAFCYVTDAMVGFMLVILKGVPGESYPGILMVDLAGRVEGVIDRAVARNIIEYPDSYPADEPNRRCPDIRKARLQLGYTALVKLDEGQRRFLDWSQRTYVGESEPSAAPMQEVLATGRRGR